MSVSSEPIRSVSVAYRENVRQYQPDPPKKKCCIWSCCKKKINETTAHERALTQHELDYSRIIRIEAAQKRALEGSSI